MQTIKKSDLARYPRKLQGGTRVLSRSGGSLADQYQKALDAANAANENRYNQILGGYDDLSKRVMGNLDQVGVTERQDIDRTYRNMGSDVYQRLVNRGFGNSTIPATMRMGVERERSSATGRLASQLAGQRAQYDTNITEGKLGVMERRTDQAPDINQMIALSQGLGQGGYGQGMGGYGGGPIGISPAQYQMSYQQALMRHMGGMGGFGQRPYQPIRANQRAQENRMRRYQQRLSQQQMQQMPQPMPWTSPQITNATMMGQYQGYGPFSNVG